MKLAITYFQDGKFRELNVNSPQNIMINYQPYFGTINQGLEKLFLSSYEEAFRSLAQILIEFDYSICYLGEPKSFKSGYLISPKGFAQLSYREHYYFLQFHGYQKLNYLRLMISEELSALIDLLAEAWS